MRIPTRLIAPLVGLALSASPSSGEENTFSFNSVRMNEWIQCYPTILPLSSESSSFKNHSEVPLVILSGTLDSVSDDEENSVALSRPGLFVYSRTGISFLGFPRPTLDPGYRSYFAPLKNTQPSQEASYFSPAPDPFHFQATEERRYRIQIEGSTLFLKHIRTGDSESIEIWPRQNQSVAAGSYETLAEYHVIAIDQQDPRAIEPIEKLLQNAVVKREDNTLAAQNTFERCKMNVRSGIARVPQNRSNANSGITRIPASTDFEAQN